jgi:hypothetical protein
MQPIEELSADGISQRLEDRIHVGAIICNQIVAYQAIVVTAEAIM